MLMLFMIVSATAFVVMMMFMLFMIVSAAALVIVVMLMLFMIVSAAAFVVMMMLMYMSALRAYLLFHHLLFQRYRICLLYTSLNCSPLLYFCIRTGIPAGSICAFS